MDLETSLETLLLMMLGEQQTLGLEAELLGVLFEIITAF